MPSGPFTPDRASTNRGRHSMVGNFWIGHRPRDFTVLDRAILGRLVEGTDMGLTTDPHDGCLHEIDENGMQQCYLILPDGERKNLVRPVYRTYTHVGIRPKHPTRDLTPEEHEHYGHVGYVKLEEYPQLDDRFNPAQRAVRGRFWTQAQLTSGCGTQTTMAQELAETYAADPSFYGSTYCVNCRGHFPVGAAGEFIWPDGTLVGTLGTAPQRMHA
jgi:hypothetical protein